MMASKGAIKPVHDLMKEAGYKFDPAVYVPAVAGYYTAPNGQMLSLPFNSSTTCSTTTRMHSRRRGSTRTSPTDVARSRAGRSEAEGLRTQVPVHNQLGGWTQLESFSAWHNTEFATLRNGFGGMGTRLAFNTPLHVRHIENLANMSKQGLFVYKGRGNTADSVFVSGECAMMTGSSALYGNIKKNAKFASGISTLPYYPDVVGAPQNTVIGGASLWVMSGKKPAEYKAVAAFFDYLSKPDVQSASHQRTGYLPITMAAYDMTDKSASTSRIRHRCRRHADDPQDHR